MSFVVLKGGQTHGGRVTNPRSEALLLLHELSPWYDLRGWLGVKQQLSIYLDSDDLSSQMVMDDLNVVKWLLGVVLYGVTCNRGTALHPEVIWQQSDDPWRQVTWQSTTPKSRLVTIRWSVTTGYMAKHYTHKSLGDIRVIRSCRLHPGALQPEVIWQ